MSLPRRFMIVFTAILAAGACIGLWSAGFFSSDPASVADGQPPSSDRPELSARPPGSPQAKLPAEKAPAFHAAQPSLTLEEFERRAVTAWGKASPAAVWITSAEDDRDGIPMESGVIVTKDGYVLTKAIPMGLRLHFLLPDGRRARGAALGSSTEWNIGLAKIAENGPWPHVEIGESADVKAGQYCLALGYASAERVPFSRQPSLRVGRVTRSAPNWFTTSCALADEQGSFLGIVDLDGRLVGLTAAVWFRHDPVHTGVGPIRRHWDDLTKGDNLDRLRLLRPGQPPRLVAAKEPDPAALERAKKATVSIRRTATVRLSSGLTKEKDKHAVSGVIVTADGYVVTCAHHFLMPGDTVTVALPDGRSVAGAISGTNLVCDISVIKIAEKGPWPHVEMGDSLSMRRDDICLVAGYPAHLREKQPLVRQTKVVEPKNNPWSCLLRTSSSCALYGGDSGGGVFDAEGRLVAVHHGSGDGGNRHARVELFREHWHELASGKPVDALAVEPLGDAAEALRHAADRLPRFTVEVLSDNSPRTLGMVVARDGLVLTKASELTGSLACRLSDRRVLPAVVQKVSRAHDLALLKVEADNLPAAEWTGLDGLSVGTCVAALVPGKTPLVGFVSYAARPIPPERGWLWASVKDGPRGLEVGEFDVPRRKEDVDVPLRKGDIVLQIEGHPTPDLKAYLQLLEPERGDPVACAGDPVCVLVLRGDKKLEFRVTLGPPTFPRPENQSRRCSGFSRAFDADMPLTPNLCGGPVIDRSGRVVGIAIACRNRSWTMVLPASEVRAALVMMANEPDAKN